MPGTPILDTMQAINMGCGMGYQEFISEVQERSGLDYDQAEQATHSFLETLGVYLKSREAKAVAGSLPHELSETLLDTASVDPGAEANGFFEYIGANTVIGHHYTTAVWGTLKELLPTEVIQRVCEQLPQAVVDTF